MSRKTNSIRVILHQGMERLKNWGVGGAALDAQLLLAHVLGCDRSYVLIHFDKELSAECIEEYGLLLAKRAEGMPVQYITGKCEFMSLDFEVNQHVLIPRPDTEILVEAAIRAIQEKGCREILEIGTGSGCIAISVAKYCGCAVTALDISKDALETARKNACHNGVSQNIRFLQADIFSSALLEQGCQYDMIISNPPYISSEVVKILGVNVIGYEPLNALDGGADGLDFYREICAKGTYCLKRDGVLFFEIGYDQRAAVEKIVIEHGYTDTICLQDLAGLDRVVYGYYNK